MSAYIWKNGILVEAFETEAGIYTSRADDGTVIETRPLTADEIAAFTLPITENTVEEKITAALAGLTPPILPTDITEAIIEAMGGTP